MKDCKRCGISKDLSEFYKHKNTRDGLYHICKGCWWLQNKAYNKQYQKSEKYQKYLISEDCQKRKKEYRIIYNSKEVNKEKRRAYEKIYRRTEKYKETARVYARKRAKKESYREYSKKYHKEYVKKMLATSIPYKLAYSIRSRVRAVLVNKRKSGSAVKDLGCTVEELVVYLESKFKTGMSWDRRSEWHIDHIRPLVSFDLEDREQFLQACHYTNLQPLWAKDNLSKGGKII